jgi:Flp pilus assembly protein TadG
LETVIVFPCVLILIWGALQTGLWFHARDVCLAAAEEGARTGAVLDGSSGAAVAAANAFLAQAARGLVESTSVSASRGREVVVTVTGKGLSIVPGWPVRIRQTARLPVERKT